MRADSANGAVAAGKGSNIVGERELGGEAGSSGERAAVSMSRPGFQDRDAPLRHRRTRYFLPGAMTSFLFLLKRDYRKWLGGASNPCQP
ncbi:MAG: hypothetical protein RLZZ303_1145 [Candidatus Hydrogenedentota bacterium]|jgi:hypothetical protein